MWCSPVANHAVQVELYYDGQWNAAPAYVRDGIALSVGAAGEGQESPPSTATVTLDDRADVYNPAAVNGPLYGLIGRNTPVRVTADGVVQADVEAAGWQPDRSLGTDPARTDRWVELQGAGILRRLQQGKTPLRAPLHRAILAAGPAAFWPMTEGKAATQLTSGLTGGLPIALLGALELGSVDGPVGAPEPMGNYAGGGGGDVALPALTAAEWGFECLLYLTPADLELDASATLFEWTANGDIGRDGWGIGMSYDPDPGGDGLGVLVLGTGTGSSVGFGVGAFNLEPGFHHLRLQAEQSGGNVDITLAVDGVVGANGTDTAAGTLGGPKDLVVRATGSTGNLGVLSGGMLAFYSGTVPDNAAAAAGYVGELAGTRFLRVLGEEGVAADLIGDEDETQPMGPQPSDTLVAIARECVRTDDGLLWDGRSMVMRTGRSMRNQDPVFTVDFDGAMIAPGLRPVFDDATTRNDVTAVRRNGSSARAVRETGPLNVSDPIDDPEGVGRYDVQVDVNPADDESLLSHATWHLAKGTVEGARYPTLTLDLDAAPSIIAAVDTLVPGDRIDITNLPASWQVGDAAMRLLGLKQSFPAGAGDYRRKVTLNLGPYAPYEQLLAGETSGATDMRGMRAGTELSTVDGSHPSNDTTILIDSAGIEWTTSAADVNPALNGGGLFLTMAGETVRVTSIAGAGSAWTLTVLRAQLGTTARTIPDGTPVRFTYPGRLGL